MCYIVFCSSVVFQFFAARCCTTLILVPKPVYHIKGAMPCT